MIDTLSLVSVGSDMGIPWEGAGAQTLPNKINYLNFLHSSAVKMNKIN